MSTLHKGRLKLLVESAIEGICIHEKGIVTDANERFCELFGYSLDELKGMDCFELIAPQPRELARRYMSAGHNYFYEVYCRKKDGTVFPVNARGSNFNIDDKKFRLVLIYDLTEQRRLQQQLAESEERYRELYQNSPIALYRTRINDGKLLECNRAFLQLFGYDSREDFNALSHAADRYVNIAERKKLLELLEKREYVRDFEVQVKRKCGEVIWIRATAQVFPDRDCIEGSMQNITASKILSRSEQRILRLVAEGKSSKEIARILHRSRRTIDEHRYRCMKKLDVGNLAEMIQKANTLRSEVDKH